MCLSICSQSISVKYGGTKALDILNKPHFFSSVFLCKEYFGSLYPFSQLSSMMDKAIKGFVCNTSHVLKPWLYIGGSVDSNKHIKFNQNRFVQTKYK